MGRVADKLAALTITTTSPDGSIRARVKAKRPEQLAFRPRTFESYDVSELERQLGRLASLSFVGYRRGVKEVVDEAGLNVPFEPQHARTLAQRGYLEDLSRLTVIGPKRDRPVVFAINGPTNWHCRVTDAGFENLSQPEFVTACLTAARDFITCFEFEKTVLRNKHFGNGKLNVTGMRPFQD